MLFASPSSRLRWISFESMSKAILRVRSLNSVGSDRSLTAFRSSLMMLPMSAAFTSKINPLTEAKGASLPSRDCDLEDYHGNDFISICTGFVENQHLPPRFTPYSKPQRWLCLIV
ncbi:hypothetical protein LIA77_00329 [Sarocladium implicatum]|nr:hypothetical protein LIA77_00329 [Sarocladium implicatum]